jgi:hypothetical protein
MAMIINRNTRDTQKLQARYKSRLNAALAMILLVEVDVVVVVGGDCPIQVKCSRVMI